MWRRLERWRRQQREATRPTLVLFLPYFSTQNSVQIVLVCYLGVCGLIGFASFFWVGVVSAVVCSLCSRHNTKP